MSLRERKKERTRQALGEAAVSLFIERGFDETTVEDIVVAAGVSRRTFFRYFSTKEAAFFASHDERFDDFVELVETRRKTMTAWQACQGAFLDVATRYESDRDGSMAWREVMLGSAALQSYDLRMDGKWEDEIRKQLIDGGSTPFDAAVRAGALMGVVRAVLDRWFKERGDLQAMGRQALALLNAGSPGQEPPVEV